MTSTTRLRIAFEVACAVAWLVSRFRPLEVHKDEEGRESPNVFAVPLVGLSWWRVALWRAEPQQGVGCIEARLLGCALEVHYFVKGSEQEAGAGAV